ncbi:MAG: zinc-dependent peptidase, partial [Pseudomonadota bacterium]
MLFVFAAFTLALAFWVYRVWRRRKWRQWLLNQPLSEADREIVLARVPLFARMPEDLRRSAEGKINLFLDQVDFYGCDGLEVTDEMMLPIAAQACMLVAGNDSWYSTLRTILLYPGAFKSQRAERDGYVITERETVRIGESWARGPVILSWADSVRGAFIDDDGHNVVFHEFAHQLDDLSGNTDGVP